MTVTFARISPRYRREILRNANDMGFNCHSIRLGRYDFPAPDIVNRSQGLKRIGLRSSLLPLQNQWGKFVKFKYQYLCHTEQGVSTCLSVRKLAPRAQGKTWLGSWALKIGTRRPLCDEAATSSCTDSHGMMNQQQT